MNQLRLLLSFDHELGLGGASSYERNLFAPTDRLIDLADELRVPITLFTDVCCAIRFRTWDREGFFQPYEEQIKSAVRRGHDVQLHLHPHWLDSEFKDGRFVPAETYSLACFRDRPEPNDIGGIVRQGIELLDELCAFKPDYNCVAYRAGGFALAPEASRILSALYQHGIRIESTVAKGYRFCCNLWEVDFTGMPAKANWMINPAGPVQCDASLGLYEIPIATRPRTTLNNLPSLAKRVFLRHRKYDSGGWSIDTGNTTLATKLKRLFPKSAWMLGFDNFTDNVDDLMKTLNYHLDAHSHDELIACSAISHPKFMGGYARRLMKTFVERVRSEFGNQVTFCSYRQFYDDVLRHQDDQSSQTTEVFAHTT